jgi:Stage II sporulation protein E (SpoIIE)/GAF domain
MGGFVIMVPTMARAGAVEVPPRTPRPVRRLDLLAALAAAAFACTAYVVALLATEVPPQGLADVLLGAAPLCALAALPILAVRARTEGVPALSWASGGLVVSLVAMVLQLISFPTVSPGGGLLSTSAQSSAALYLLFHLAFAGGAVAGALEAPSSWRAPSVAVGVALAFLFSVDAIPLPLLLRPDGTYTTTLILAEYALTLVIGACAVVWVWRTGLAPQPLRGWVGVALSLSAYDVLLNAFAGSRFEAVWWASLSMRAAIYAVLAGGAIWTVLAKLADLELYTDSELDRREGQLRHSLNLTRQLLSCAEDLAQAMTPGEVAEALCADAVEACDAPYAAAMVSHLDDRLRLLGTSGYDAAMTEQAERVDWDAPLPGARAILTGEPLFLSTEDEVRERFPGAQAGFRRRVGALAALPMKVRHEPIGSLLVWDSRPREWSPSHRALLTGLAAQGGQAIARAQAFEDQANAARTLQESLLPSRLPCLPNLDVAARYVAGESGLRVGGDWYDCVEVGDHLVALVVGDVMGKGLHAAALMGQLRTTLRTLTVIDPSPSAVLTAMDRVTQDLDPDEIATIVYVLLDLSTGAARIARAGHLPPLLTGPDGQTRAVYGGGSPPLGAPTGERGEVELQIPVGSVLVLYSDGMVEDRETGLGPGLSTLIESAGRLTAQPFRSLEPMADALLDGANQPQREDDVTLLLARRGNHATAATLPPAIPQRGQR